MHVGGNNNAPAISSVPPASGYLSVRPGNITSARVVEIEMSHGRFGLILGGQYNASWQRVIAPTTIRQFSRRRLFASPFRFRRLWRQVCSEQCSHPSRWKTEVRVLD